MDTLLPSEIPLGIEKDDVRRSDLEMLKVAYGHYQHLENIRIRYVTFLYTFLFAAIAFIGAISRLNAFDARLLVISTVLGIVIFLYSQLIYRQMLAINAAVSGYDAIISGIWARCYPNRKTFILNQMQGARVPYFLNSAFTWKFEAERFDITPDLSLRLISFAAIFSSLSIIICSSWGFFLLYSESGLSQLYFGYDLIPIINPTISATFLAVAWGFTFIPLLTGVKMLLDSYFGPNSNTAFDLKRATDDQEVELEIPKVSDRESPKLWRALYEAHPAPLQILYVLLLLAFGLVFSLLFNFGPPTVL